MNTSTGDNAAVLSTSTNQASKETEELDNSVFIDKTPTGSVLDKNLNQSVNVNSQDMKNIIQSTADNIAKNQVQNASDNQSAKRNTESLANDIHVSEINNEEVSENKAIFELNDKPPEVSAKSVVNPLLDGFSQREVSQSIQREIDVNQREQSYESVMSSITSDITQTQKHSSVQQAEVISIMRKDFNEAVKEKVMVMINQKLQQIDIQLDPPEFGSMQVKIHMQNDQAVVNFVVQNQQAKEALDQNLDKLKNMMADSGVDVGDANVEQQANQSSSHNDGNDQNQNSDNGKELLAEAGTEQNMDVNSLNMFKASSTGVDYYA